MLVEFLIPTYDRKFPLYSMLSSLAAQTDPDWIATILVDGGKVEQFRTDFISILNLPNIKIRYMERRFNDWGHSLRQIGKEESIADYIVMTGDDNYYTPNFVAELRKAVDKKPALVYWDMIHSHYKYTWFNCKLGLNQIDMGAFATRNDIIKKINIKTRFAADGEFIREFMTRFRNEKTVKINKTLFIHN